MRAIFLVLAPESFGMAVSSGRPSLVSTSSVRRNVLRIWSISTMAKKPTSKPSSAPMAVISTSCGLTGDVGTWAGSTSRAGGFTKSPAAVTSRRRPRKVWYSWRLVWTSCSIWRAAISLLPRFW